jgi:hypothetical protein
MPLVLKTPDPGRSRREPVRLPDRCDLSWSPVYDLACHFYEAVSLVEGIKTKYSVSIKQLALPEDISLSAALLLLRERQIVLEPNVLTFTHAGSPDIAAKTIADKRVSIEVKGSKKGYVSIRPPDKHADHFIWLHFPEMWSGRDELIVEVWWVSKPEFLSAKAYDINRGEFEKRAGPALSKTWFAFGRTGCRALSNYTPGAEQQGE